MRRLVLSLAVACASAVLSACAGSGGYVFNGTNGGKIDHVVFSAGNASPGIFKLAPIAGAVLPIVAIGTKGSQNAVVPDQTFVWSASIASGGQPYGNSVSGVSGTCPTPVAGTIINQDAVTSPLALRFPSAGGALIGSTSTGSPNPTTSLDPYDPARQSDTVIVVPVAGQAPPYCLTVAAKHLGDGVLGTVTVLVSN